jgi:membrane associated rhomboid family serine protease
VFPYRDENETVRTPVVTFVIIGLTIAAWLLVQGAGSALPLAKSVCNLGLIPAELMLRTTPGVDGFAMGEHIACFTDPGRQVSHVVTSMFLHGSWMHLLGNMWFMWIFGNNVEDSMGRPRFVAFYLLSGIGAAAAQVFIRPASILPMVGASGAISGVMGAYVVLYPRVKVYTLVPIGFFLTTIALPAWVMLGYWMLLNVLGGLPSLGGGAEGGGVAFWAHIGGFAVGVALIKLFARPEYIAEHKARTWRPQRMGWRGGSWKT